MCILLLRNETDISISIKGKQTLLKVITLTNNNNDNNLPRYVIMVDLMKWFHIVDDVSKNINQTSAYCIIDYICARNK